MKNDWMSSVGALKSSTRLRAETTNIHHTGTTVKMVAMIQMA
jgi:hypothetical protein